MYQFCSVKHTDIRHINKITVANGSGISLESRTTHFLNDGNDCFCNLPDNAIIDRHGHKCNHQQIRINY